jgi:hypothetical protein
MDNIRKDFENDLIHKKEQSINMLIQNYKLLELLALEPLRKEYARKISAIKDSQNVS